MTFCYKQIFMGHICCAVSMHYVLSWYDKIYNDTMTSEHFKDYRHFVRRIYRSTLNGGFP